jgi:hypothetical protein
LPPVDFVALGSPLQKQSIAPPHKKIVRNKGSKARKDRKQIFETPSECLTQVGAVIKPF